MGRIATVLSGLITGLVLFIAIRVLTGLGEGVFYSNDRSLIARESPPEKRSLGMGIVITGLAIGITLALVFAPDLIKLGGNVFTAEDAWRMTFLVFGAATLVVGVGCRTSRSPRSRSSSRSRWRRSSSPRRARRAGRWCARATTG